MFFDDVLEEDRDGVAEEDRIRHLHHRRLEVQRHQHALRLGVLHFLFVERTQRLAVHHAGVDDLASLQCELVLEHRGAAVGRDEFDARRGCFG